MEITKEQLDGLQRYELAIDYQNYITTSNDGEYIKLDDVLTLLDGERNDFLTIRESQEFLKCSRQQIYILFKAGKLTRHKRLGRTYISKKELESISKIK